MKIFETAKNFLIKLQGLPEEKKKIILWSIVTVLGLIMAYFWIINAADNFSKIGNGVVEDFNIPKEEIEDINFNIDIPLEELEESDLNINNQIEQ